MKVNSLSFWTLGPNMTPGPVAEVYNPSLGIQYQSNKSSINMYYDFNTFDIFYMLPKASRYKNRLLSSHKVQALVIQMVDHPNLFNTQQHAFVLSWNHSMKPMKLGPCAQLESWSYTQQIKDSMVQTFACKLMHWASKPIWESVV